MARSVAVVGGGVAGLAAAMHMVELWTAAQGAGGAPEPLHLRLVAPLVPTGGDGSGLGGKAMSRSFAGPADAHGNLRAPFYGPMMPERGTIPHGYHVLWAYPNLRRLLGAGAPDEPTPRLDGGLLRPPGGAGLLAVFQGRVDDPAPGGPGLALMGLCDPQRPETAFRPVTQALLRLRGDPLLQVFAGPFHALFGALADGVDPLFFADLLFADEVDLEMRLALVAASLSARRTDPENDRVEVDGQAHPLWAVPYEAWLRASLARWGTPLLGRLRDRTPEGVLAELRALSHLLDTFLDDEDRPGPLDRALRALLPDRAEARYDDLRLVIQETERLLLQVPGALAHLLSGRYPLAATLHFRFGPDATFTSPYDFDAASAVRSLAFVFTSPQAARAWSADGGRMHRLWLRLWGRLRAAAEATGGGVTLEVLPGRATAIRPEAGAVALEVTPVVGHDFGPPQDLGWPHTHALRAWGGPAQGVHEVQADRVIPTLPPTELRALLPPQARASDAALAPLVPHQNATLELLVWLRRPIAWSPEARRGLAESSITGLEGGFCLLADYACGLWSPEVLAEEDPFGDGAFAGSILESCGAWEEVFACLDRDDAFGWPAEVKAALADLLAQPAHVGDPDPRPWSTDPARWQGRRAGGGWSAERAADPAAREDWFVAARWLCWQFLRQLATVQALGPRAVRQLAHLARRLDPRGQPRAALLDPPADLRAEVRYVAMINAKPRNRIFSPAVGTWPLRPVSGAPLPDLPAVFPAGDWTRNGLDVICMEAAALSGMRAARGAWASLWGRPPAAPGPLPVLPRASWYAGLDPLLRGDADARDAEATLGVRS